MQYICVCVKTQLTMSVWIYSQILFYFIALFICPSPQFNLIIVLQYNNSLGGFGTYPVAVGWFGGCFHLCAQMLISVVLGDYM